MARILAFDPGKITGYADLTLGEDLQVTLGEIHLWERLFILPFSQCSDVAYEHFAGTTIGVAIDPTAFKVIGAIRTLSKMFDKPCIIQTQEMRKFALKRFPSLFENWRHGPHRRDALCHALVYAYNVYHLRDIKMTRDFQIVSDV